MGSMTMPAPKRASSAEATVPLPPSTNNLFRGEGVKRFKTTEYKDWIAVADLVLATIRPPTAFPCALLIRVLGKVHASRDLDNMLKPIGDSLKRSGVIPQDDVRHLGEWVIRHEPSLDNPFAVVSFRPLDNKPVPANLFSEVEADDYRELLRRSIDSRRKPAKKGTAGAYLWFVVCEILGVGSTRAHQICTDLGLDPDEKVEFKR